MKKKSISIKGEIKYVYIYKQRHKLKKGKISKSKRNLLDILVLNHAIYIYILVSSNYGISVMKGQQSKLLNFNFIILYIY